jgi:hypothetical protein
MNNEFCDQIYNNLKLKETDELVTIWETNNRAEWTDIAFDVIQEILLHRLDTLPKQDEPTYEIIEADSNEETDFENEQVDEDISPDIINRANLECYNSKFKSLKVWLSGILMISICYYCTTVPEIILKIFGWFGILFFGYAFLVITIQLFHSELKVLIDHEGITAYRRKIITIQWHEIKKIWIGNYQRQRFLCVKLENPEIYLSNFSMIQSRFIRIHESMGFAHISISFVTLTPSLDEVVGFIKAKHPEKIE